MFWTKLIVDNFPCFCRTISQIADFVLSPLRLLDAFYYNILIVVQSFVYKCLSTNYVNQVKDVVGTSPDYSIFVWL